MSFYNNEIRAIISALSQLLGMFGSEDCKNEMILFARTNRTNELSTLDDVSPKLNQCLANYNKSIAIREKPDFTLQLLFSNCLLYESLIETRNKDEEYNLTKLKSKVLNWTNYRFPMNPNEIKGFWEEIMCLNEHNVTFNPTIFGNNYDIIQTCKEYILEISQHLSAKNQLVSLLLTNELFKDILIAINSTANQIYHNEDPQIVYYFDSLHDINILAILNRIGNFGKYPVDFGTSLYKIS